VVLSNVTHFERFAGTGVAAIISINAAFNLGSIVVSDFLMGTFWQIGFRLPRSIKLFIRQILALLERSFPKTGS
jgi:hypothetical protein